MFGIDMLSNPVTGFVLQCAIVLSLFSLLVWIIYAKWNDGKRPAWLESLYGYTKQFVQVPKWIVRFTVINPCRFALELQETLIENVRKMRSRMYIALGLIFYPIFAILNNPKLWESDPQTLYGFAAVLTALEAGMILVLNWFIKSRNEDHDRTHKEVLAKNGHGDDAPDIPPMPDLSPTKGSKGFKKKRR